LATRPRIIFHIDMDSFYASVEIQRNPSLKGKPVIVGADPKAGTGRGVVSTCSYEARRYGVRSGMPISKAYKLCPNGVYLPVNISLYEKASERIEQILKRYADKVERVGIDEAFIDVTEKVKEYGSAKELALKVKDAIYIQEGLTCSIGVAPNKSVAKIASDFKKPNGLTVVEPNHVGEFLDPLPVTKIIGVGKKTYSVLMRFGLETIGQVARYPREDLAQVFGKFGIYLWEVANGIDYSEVQEVGEPKSFSQEHTYEKDTDDQSLVLKTLQLQAENLYRQLVEMQYQYRTVTLKIRFKDFETFIRSRSLPSHTYDKEAIMATVRILLREFENDPRKIRLVGLKVSDLRKLDQGVERIERWL
jgi:DNA polymerase IV (DinB-like DNA polymerase)